MIQHKQHDNINKQIEKAESRIVSSFKGIYDKIVSKREYLAEQNFQSLDKISEHDKVWKVFTAKKQAPN